MAADIMKTRDVGLPPYNRYRELCKLPVAEHFHDLYQWMPKEQVEAITAAYEHIDDVDLMAGLLGERAMPGAVMGPTLACIMTEQLLRWRRSERFWYENTVHPGAFTGEQLREIKRISMSKIMCAHADSVEAIQPNVFYLPGRGNEITDCSRYEAFNFAPWKDHECERDGEYLFKIPHQTWWSPYLP
ncbi:peroxidase mlt-7-like [Ostrinia nubilalis]|uniref:peroxidase mlt-7-like n=1 Tax=Ostrinia nubilalis TaxID=29057 RepID=UPI003082374D